MSDSCRKHLERSLASLLGFDIEDVVDVIEHLLSFESKDDLLEHLTALLGREDDDVRTFVDNVVKYQNGEIIESNSLSTCSNESVQQSEQQSVVNEKRKEEEVLKKKKEEEMILIERMKLEQQKELDRIKQQNMVQTKRQHIIIQKKKETDSNTKNNNNNNNSDQKSPIKLKNNQSSRNKTDIPNVNNLEKKHPSMPIKGKAKINCSCYGTIHKPLINCLHCGRIACTKEGYGYCPFCSYLIEEHRMAEGEEIEKALLHKERLLQFDRDSASRTQVYDSQADYYSNSSSNWLSEKEQLDAAIKEEERKKNLHSIKHVMNLDI